MRSRPVELDVSHNELFGSSNNAYEKLIEDALEGNSQRFARSDGIDQQWRIVEPVIDQPSKVEPYSKGSWGPASAAAIAEPYGGWQPPSCMGKTDGKA